MTKHLQSDNINYEKILKGNSQNPVMAQPCSVPLS